MIRPTFVLLLVAASSVAIACGGKVRGDGAPSSAEPDPSATSGSSGSSGATGTGSTNPAGSATGTSPTTEDCPNGKTTSFPINISLCEAQLQSQTTTCDGATICGWTLETPCSLGYVDCKVQPGR